MMETYNDSGNILLLLGLQLSLILHITMEIAVLTYCVLFKELYDAQFPSFDCTKYVIFLMIFINVFIGLNSFIRVFQSRYALLGSAKFTITQMVLYIIFTMQYLMVLGLWPPPDKSMAYQSQNNSKLGGHGVQRVPAQIFLGT